MRRISVCFLSIDRKHSPFQNYCVSKPIIQIPYVLGDFEMSLTTEGPYLRFRQLVDWKDYKTKTMTTIEKTITVRSLKIITLSNGNLE